VYCEAATDVRSTSQDLTSKSQDVRDLHIPAKYKKMEYMYEEPSFGISDLHGFNSNV